MLGVAMHITIKTLAEKGYSKKKIAEIVGCSCQWSLNFDPFWSLKNDPPLNFIHESCSSLSLTRLALTFSLSR